MNRLGAREGTDATGSLCPWPEDVGVFRPRPTRCGTDRLHSHDSGAAGTLRPVSREDYPALFRWRSSFEAVHMLNFRRRIATFEEFVRELEGMLPQSILLLVRRAKTGDPIGYALGYNINQWDGCMGVGLYVEPRLQLRGYGGEAALRYVDFLFRNFPLRRITTEIYEFATGKLKPKCLAKHVSHAWPPPISHSDTPWVEPPRSQKTRSR